MNITEFRDLLQAKVIGNGTTDLISTLHTSIDSRSLENNENTLFFALKGHNHNGHDYIPELIKCGVRFFVVSELPSLVSDGLCYFIVDDVLVALQKYAAAIRSAVSFPVIGITGSKGKTLVKEWLNFLLNPEFTIIKSPKSYNSQTGVALSLLGIKATHDLGIFEAGISTTNEMGRLEYMLKPSLGVLTSIGTDHQEGFDSIEEKISEKLQLFKDTKTLVFQYDKRVLNAFGAKERVFCWSFEKSDNAQVFLESIGKQYFRVHYQENCFEVYFPFVDAASLENTATCIAVLLKMGYDPNVIEERIAQLYPVELRLQVKHGQHNCVIIDDSYNADFASLKIALDFLEKHKSTTIKTVILSDVFQSGVSEDALYDQVASILEANNITRLIGVGPSISKYLNGKSHVFLYPTVEDFLQRFNIDEFQNETILVKGARSFHFDRIVSLLEAKTHETILEVNLNALRHNLNFYRLRLKPETKIMVMVKASGYGNGSFEIAKLLSHEKVDYLGVAFADEGIALRKAGIHIPIIVMNPEVSAFPAMLAYQLEPEIFSIAVLETFLKVARLHNEYQYPIHLKIDSGMHRLGFLPKDYDQVIALLKQTNVLEVKSIFSHLSSSDMPENREFTLKQIADFQEACAILSSGLEIEPIRHILNTSGVFHFPEHQLEMVRVGIGLYGVGNDEEENMQLQSVSALKTKILQIRELSEGESVGYGRRFKTTRITRIATIPIGYADGVHRSWGNSVGWVYIKECKAPIVGSICMDMLMVDITDVNCVEGDDVEIFGKNLSVSEIASVIGTIPYEIMTSISPRVKRVFFEE